MSNSVIKTAGRVFEILEYMRRVRRSVPVREISDELGYPLSSTQVLLKSIAQLGYLRYDTRRRAYLPTPQLALLGDWVLDGMAGMGVDIQILEDIARETGLTAILGIENDIYVQYTHVVLGAGSETRYRTQPGTRRLLCMSSLGWALLSKQNLAYLSRIVDRTNNRLNDNGQQVRLQQVETHVLRAKDLGYAYSEGTTNPDRAMVGVATQADDSGMHYAIGLSGPLEEVRARRKEIVGLLGEKLGMDILDGAY